MVAVSTVSCWVTGNRGVIFKLAVVIPVASSLELYFVFRFFCVAARLV